MDQHLNVCEVVITAPDEHWLIEFARGLVVRHLCASAHNTGPFNTIYRWRGELYDTNEAQVVLHTRVQHVGQIIERVSREHPYEVPSVIVRPIMDGNIAYLRWIVDETEPPEQ
jgi:periplasmic divalent cation tolerance protein